MSNWESKSVSDTINDIFENVLVLPVIQRRLVWAEDKMELLFDTLLKGESFGGIMTIQEEANFEPLFAFRYFTKDGKPQSSFSKIKLERNHNLVIDGQQRLQSFYIGLTGSINRKILYFDLFSDFKNMEFDFEFENDESKLPKKNQDRNEDAFKETKWISIPSLFMRLKETNNEDQVADEIIKRLNIINEKQKEHVARNIRTFYKNVFSSKHVGLARVTINRALDPVANRQRVVELFIRLNDGGTKLSSFDLVASKLKGYEWGMEEFLDKILKDYTDIGITQDTLIKLVFILSDNQSKEMSNIEQEDATFAINNNKRIAETLKALKMFLIAAKLYDYYKNENRSFIPLYFVAYHIFNKSIPDDQLKDIFVTYDTTNTDYRNLYKWMYLSLLSGVFKSKGAGWIPYKTGIKKILGKIKNFKGKDFPIKELFDVYRLHPVYFYDTFEESNLNSLEKTFLFYILYDREAITRSQDIDHIHPISLLENKYDYQFIHIVENYQLLDPGTNRGIKNNKPLKEWIKNFVQNKNLYIKRHLIPENEDLWEIENYTDFLSERRGLIIHKINSILSI
ncbi:MAG: DUF262 domain-containing protein (plasmid) [Candidatus Methanoperedens sp.]|uniref:DUF262 domain-containing protein n=1 Tax=Candidatus Methanoperedens sp. BLZ2 TaxID=2035255 RepID=UPI000BE3CDBF|nr:DUF262 domain-containing protein [Candidatus Methanoperedens sp. BLZ2]KAB2946418.1 MAG: DUF262 domain-containing protein [Candidatus Methanoperedens sp.]MBZ0175654.1 DUF262 domain-containing HNH endonuclease family protein [Candidatus Methanoperedens nitroreducens]WAH95075.1 MAG: DUF262 domain-containing protein [Candidatus Methanoperedens sp.]WAM22203.1 MAG: DUF262 domain-containing protein [Candidatus Methanoperedens sp.]